MLRACMAGQAHVKEGGETYLPMPSGFKSLSDKGVAAYDAYRIRADVPDWMATTVGAMTGIAHGKEIGIQIPPALEYLEENADGRGMPIEAFHRRITRNILAFGRYGVLADAPSTGGDPYLVGYAAEAIINWDNDFFVLDETYNKRVGYGWEKTARFRVLELVDGRLVSEIHEGLPNGAMQPSGTYLPSALGGAGLDFIPFAAANARDVLPAIETPPLIGVANAMISHYRLSADYRHQLFMSGQETLVAINGLAPSMVGAGVVHSMTGADGVTPDLKYVSPSCSGIEAHKEAMDAQRQSAIQAGARMLESSETGSAQESGHARSLRFASETANLLSVVQTSCALLERALRFAAMMRGLDPKDVVVSAPVELLDTTMTAAEAQALTAVWQAGGLSWETYHENLKRGGIASSERSAEEEMRLIDDERAAGDDTGIQTNPGETGQPQ